MYSLGAVPIAKSHPARGGWIEIQISSTLPLRMSSHPARGGWIEIVATPEKIALISVPPRKGWVD